MADTDSRIDRFLSLAVGLAAIAAAVVSLYQANLARAQLRASAWPYLTQSNSWEGGTYHWQATNEGVGPARVKSFRVLVDSVPVPTWNAAARALTGQGDSALVYSSFRRGSVLPAGGTRALLTLPNRPRALAFWTAAQSRLRTVTCYCSVYDECWVADTDREEPEPVRSCSADEATEFRQ